MAEPRSRLQQPTPAQRRAADPRRSVWVTANAGTGKTRVLTDRLLRLLLDGVDPESILGITFTKAAAAEMTARLEERLADWAVMQDEKALAAELEALIGESPKREVRDRARRLFARVLELPRGLAVMTIHSFCQSLLRRFPLEAGVPPHFEVLDERTTQELLAEARQVVMGERRAADPAVAEALEMLAALLPETSLGEAIDEVACCRTRLARAKQRFGGLEGLLATIHRELGVVPGLEPPALIARFCADGMYDAAGLMLASNALLRSSAVTDKERGSLILTWLNSTVSERNLLYEGYKRCFLTAEGEGLKSLGTKQIGDGPRRVLAAEQARVLEHESAIRALVVARRTQALLTVGDAVIDAYETLKRRSAGLDYDDLIESARGLLADSGRTAWVLFKLDQRIDHLLVDEAQDTSPAQWAIVERLVEEFFAGQGAKSRPRTLFVVGDEKQSIYSFQGADLATFRRVHRAVERRAADARQPLGEEVLDLSFRAVPAVLDVVDRVLALPELCPAVVAPGAEVRHDTIRRQAAGLVELWPLADPSEGNPELPRWPLPNQARSEDKPERRLAEAIARTVAGWLEAGERLESQGRPLTAGDVLILVSRRGEIQELLIRALKRARVPVAGADRLSLVEHIAVRDLIALGRAILLPEDDLNLAALLKSPLMGLADAPQRYGLDEDELLLLAYDRGQLSLMERLRAFARERRSERFVRAYERLSAWLGRADYVPPFELFTEILGCQGGRERLLARLGRDAEEPIEAFLGQALAYERGHPASLQGFLHWLCLDQQQLKRDPEQRRDAVRVLTVHGAKGLEAPVVILADAGPHKPAHSERLIWRDSDDLPFWRVPKNQRDAVSQAAVEACEEREAAERLRLLYVALTRAQDRLYVTGWLPRTEAKDSSPCWHELVRRAMAGAPTVERLTVTLGRGVTGQALRLRTGVPIAAVTAPAVVRAEPSPIPHLLRTPPAPERALLRMHAAASLLTDGPAPTPQAMLERARRRRHGVLAHRLLQLVPALPCELHESAMLRWLGQVAEDLLADDHRAIADRVLALIRHPELALLFGPEARAEQAIVGEIAGLVVTGQVDRLHIGPETVTVVDFKTSRQPPPSPELTPLAYLRQMAAYRALLGGLHPQHAVRCGLIWTETVEITWLPDDLLLRHAPGGG